MSTKIRVSYEKHPELLEVVARLAGLVDKVKLQEPKGKYRLAYIDLKPLPCPGKSDIMEP